MWQELKVRIGIKTHKDTFVSLFSALWVMLVYGLSRQGLLTCFTLCYEHFSATEHNLCSSRVLASEGLPSAELLGSENMKKSFGLPSCNILTLCLSQAWVERIAAPLPQVKLCSRTAAWITPTTHSITSLLIGMRPVICFHISPVPEKKTQTWGIQSWI